jgi:hypothetical protein
LDSKGEEAEVSEKAVTPLPKKGQVYWKGGWQHAGFLRADPDKFLPDGELTVFCTVTLMVNTRVKGELI